MSLYKEEQHSLQQDYEIIYTTTEYSGIKTGFSAY